MQGIAHQPRFIQCCNAVGGVAALTAVVVPILLHKQRSSVELCAEQLTLLKGNEALFHNNELVSNSFHNPKLVVDFLLNSSRAEHAHVYSLVALCSDSCDSLTF